MSGPSTESVAAQFESHVVRRTRFGGLHLKRCQWEFDVWPVHETYAFRTGGHSSPSFEALPRTTFLNLEAIAVDVWAPAGKARKLYAADDAFFVGMLRQEIEINSVENPFPELCVIRSLVLAASLCWRLGPKLSSYVARVGPQLRDDQVVAIQIKHYGRIVLSVGSYRRALVAIRDAVDSGIGSGFCPFVPTQMTFWPEDDSPVRRISLRMMKVRNRSKRAVTAR